jgi:putative transcriptional regulator
MVPGTYDSIDALLSRYVAGALPEPARVLVAAHLELKPDNRRFVSGLEALAGNELAEGSPAEMVGRDARLQAIFASDTPAPVARATRGGEMFPRAMLDFFGFDADRVPWRTKMPGFREFEMGEVDGCHVSLFWIRPGRKIPHHTHDGSELTLVVDGAFRDDTGRYGRGDIAMADQSTNHRPIAEKDVPCISFAVTDAPLRFNGPLGQRLSDILGF